MGEGGFRGISGTHRSGVMRRYDTAIRVLKRGATGRGLNMGRHRIDPASLTLLILALERS